MDTKKVEELLRKITNAEAQRSQLEAEVAEVQKRLQAQSDLALEFKKELAEELREVLDATRTPAASKGQGGTRQRGVTAAALAVFDDGKEHTVEDAAKALEKDGLATGNLSIALSTLARKGRLTRIGRGLYVKVKVGG